MQKTSVNLGCYQISSCRHGETHPFSSCLQETQTDSGGFTNAGWSELAQRPGWPWTHHKSQFYLQRVTFCFRLNQHWSILFFLLKIMNMYGELIMESSHHKVIWMMWTELKEPLLFFSLPSFLHIILTLLKLVFVTSIRVTVSGKFFQTIPFINFFFFFSTLYLFLHLIEKAGRSVMYIPLHL